VSTDVLRLYSYWRSSAAYRVRIALNLKQLQYETVPVHLLRDGGEQHGERYSKINPQQMVPALAHGYRVMQQSMAIIEYLDETWPDPPLLPAVARDRARARALAEVIACDTHPLNNLRVLQYLEHTWSVPMPEREGWIRHWMHEGFKAVEGMLAEHPSTGTFCDGELPGLADCCLIPQVYSARRYAIDMTPYPTIRRIHSACMALPAFEAARPENQPDAPSGN
jgi:maleylacetoacetate isomerase